MTNDKLNLFSCFIRADQCYQFLDHGSGTKQITSYGFVPGDDRCEAFVYKGSGGNSNRFSSIEECERVCLV